MLFKKNEENITSIEKKHKHIKYLFKKEKNEKKKKRTTDFPAGT